MNPALWRTVGITFTPPVISVENSPSTILSAKPGTASKVGRLSALPKAIVTSAFVAGFGAVKLTGPEMSLVKGNL